MTAASNPAAELTEDATRMGGMLGTMTDPYRGRAADTAAEEPRTEAQVKAEALSVVESLAGEMSAAAYLTLTQHLRADEEAGS